MWYDQTKKDAVPSDILATAIHEIGPRFDGVKMEHRAVVLWKRGDYNTGYLFATPQALRGERMTPMVVPIKGKPRLYHTKPVGYIGEPGGYCPPGYERTPLPNRLDAYILTAVEPITPAAPIPAGDLVVRPIYND